MMSHNIRGTIVIHSFHSGSKDLMDKLLNLKVKKVETNDDDESEDSDEKRKKKWKERKKKKKKKHEK